MLGEDDNDNSERLIPAGTEDSAAIGADEIKRLKRKSPKANTANNNGSVTQSQQQIQRAPPAIPAAVPVAAVPAASTRQQPQQQQMQRSQQQQQQRQKQSTAARRKAGPNARQAQLQQQLATNDDEESYVYEPKKGHNLFFLFCDTKRAVLILSSFDFFILALSMTRNWRTAQANGIGFDMSNEFTKKFVTQACALFIDIATIVGALWYSTMIVLVGFLFKCYQLVVSSMSAAQNWQNDTEFIASMAVLAGLNVFFLYAAGAFMWETHKGILTKENYQRREKYSCCCEC
mmetsp:Transcript_29713/g.59735  ORF Transcript_29713/g.59735 Transcript_29713/m.59735 type:complete len:289 (-) Transcript_29713:99-965(-)